MGNRLSKITTRTGDDGTTGLGDGSRVPKDSPRIEAIGTVDELNSAIGVLLTADLPGDIAATLLDIQHRLFDLGGELSIPGYTLLTGQHVLELEQRQEALNESLPPLKEFILPGGSRDAASCHIARAVCRRAERCLVGLAKSEPVSAEARKYLNRLSDYLFVAARYINRSAGQPDVLWRHDRKKT